jgi:hypothetical protein
MHQCSQTHIPVTLQQKKRQRCQLHKTPDWFPSWPRRGGFTGIEPRSCTHYQSRHWPSWYQGSTVDVWCIAPVFHLCCQLDPIQC